MDQTERKEVVSCSEFYRSLLQGDKHTTTEWFRILANQKDCNIFPFTMDRMSRVRILVELMTIFPDMSSYYRKRGYQAIMDAINDNILKEAIALIKDSRFFPV